MKDITRWRQRAQIISVLMIVLGFYVAGWLLRLSHGNMLVLIAGGVVYILVAATVLRLLDRYVNGDRPDS